MAKNIKEVEVCVEVSEQIEPVEYKIPRGAINAIICQLLPDVSVSYDEIVQVVRQAYPTANTSTKSVASIARDLRADGVFIPSRRQEAKPKAPKAPEYATKTEDEVNNILAALRANK